MNTSNLLIDSFGSLLSFTAKERKKNKESKKTEPALSYNLDVDKVSSNWLDVSVLLHESYNKALESTDTDEAPVSFDDLRKRRNFYNLSSGLSAELLETVILGTSLPGLAASSTKKSLDQIIKSKKEVEQLKNAR